MFDPALVEKALCQYPLADSPDQVHFKAVNTTVPFNPRFTFEKMVAAQEELERLRPSRIIHVFKGTIAQFLAHAEANGVEVKTLSETGDWPHIAGLAVIDCGERVLIGDDRAIAEFLAYESLGLKMAITPTY